MMKEVFRLYYSICYVIKVFLTQKTMVSLGGIKWEHGNIGEK